MRDSTNKSRTTIYTILWLFLICFIRVSLAGLPTKFYCVAKNSTDRRNSKLVPVRMNVHLELECLGPKEDECYNLNTKKACKGRIRQNRLDLLNIEHDGFDKRNLVYKKVKTVGGKEIFKLVRENNSQERLEFQRFEKNYLRPNFFEILTNFV